eukprot:scpid53546/ scgid33002/ Selenoprotein O
MLSLARQLAGVHRRTSACHSAAMSTLTNLRFDNLQLRSLPVEEKEPIRSRQVLNACFSLVKPTPVENPSLVCASDDALNLLGITGNVSEEELAEVFSGNSILPGSTPAAHCYCGHQFGYFSGQLGDGAAISLGEVLGRNDERWEIQLKGAGLTPFSRTADGRKVLRSSIREFLCSEAMHHLGIPTTRAGTCVTSDTQVLRDKFYTGQSAYERATVVLRISPTFLRFGSFEIFKSPDESTGRAGPSEGDVQLLEKLLDFAIHTYFPQISTSLSTEEQRLGFFREVVESTARLVAEWQCVGFCHGVLNTDNMSIMGITIDYGPFGFMDSFNPNFICNSSDEEGRYSYKKQPEMCRWNLGKFAEALSPVLSQEKTSPLLDRFDSVYQEHYLLKMRQKLGLVRTDGFKDHDSELLEALFETMQKTGSDFTNTFLLLAVLQPSDEVSTERCASELAKQCSTVAELRAACKPQISDQQLGQLSQLMQVQPGLFGDPRALGPIKRELDKAQRYKALEAVSEESKQTEDRTLWIKWLDMYRKRLLLDIENLSADALLEAHQKRRDMMGRANPKVVLRNYIAQQAIEKAEKGDFSEVRRVLAMLQHPFDAVPEPQAATVTAGAQPEAASCAAAAAVPPPPEGETATPWEDHLKRPPLWAASLKVS